MDEEQLEQIASQAAELARADPAWWEIAAALSPLAVLIGAVVTLWIGLASVRRQRNNAEKQSADNRKAMAERRRADDRAEWWKRVQWALDASLSDQVKRQDLGFKMLDRLTAAGKVDDEDLTLLDPAWRPTAASSAAQAEETMDTASSTLQAMAAQGIIGDDYLAAYQRVMDEAGTEEHNGTDTGDREDGNERNAQAEP